jgi:hypothetical protein
LSLIDHPAGVAPDDCVVIRAKGAATVIRLLAGGCAPASGEGQRFPHAGSVPPPPSSEKAAGFSPNLPKTLQKLAFVKFG